MLCCVMLVEAWRYCSGRRGGKEGMGTNERGWLDLRRQTLPCLQSLRVRHWDVSGPSKVFGPGASLLSSGVESAGGRSRVKDMVQGSI